MFVPFTEEQQMVFQRVLTYLKSQETTNDYSKEIYEGVKTNSDVKQIFRIHKEFDQDEPMPWYIKANLKNDTLFIYLRTESYGCGKPYYRNDKITEKGIQYGKLGNVESMFFSFFDRKSNLYGFPIFSSYFK